MANTHSKGTVEGDTEWTEWVRVDLTVEEQIEEFKDILKTIHEDKFFRKIFSLRDSEFTTEEWELALEIFKKR